MSFQSREKKRRSAAEQRAALANRTPATAGRWFRTLATRRCCCNTCGGVLAENREMVYRHAPRTVLCCGCAEQAGISARPSIRWVQARRQ